jgi:hypothetical protein
MLFLGHIPQQRGVCHKTIDYYATFLNPIVVWQHTLHRTVHIYIYPYQPNSASMSSGKDVPTSVTSLNDSLLRNAILGVRILVTLGYAGFFVAGVWLLPDSEQVITSGERFYRYYAVCNDSIFDTQDVLASVSSCVRSGCHTPPCDSGLVISGPLAPTTGFCFTVLSGLIIRMENEISKTIPSYSKLELEAGATHPDWI